MIVQVSYTLHTLSILELYLSHILAIEDKTLQCFKEQNWLVFWRGRLTIHFIYGKKTAPEVNPKETLWKIRFEVRFYVSNVLHFIYFLRGFVIMSWNLLKQVWHEETFLMVFFISWLGFTESRKDASKSLLFFTNANPQRKGQEQ